ncbi:MAG: outer membrane lipoprotein carrier protein LolA [Alphaproteobacteria bacterium]
MRNSIITWILAFAGITFLLLAALPVLAEQPKFEATFLSQNELQEHAEDISRIETYLTGLTTIVADFTQFAPDGTLTAGKFFLKRPGKMRWQYDPPTPVLIVANETQLVFFDRELEQVSYIPISESLIGFMAKDVIRFDEEVGVSNFEKNANVIRVTLAEPDRPTEGSLMLEFTDKPLLIRNMVITDTAGQVTSVALNNATFGTKLDNKLFVFRDPRKRTRH